VLAENLVKYISILVRLKPLSSIFLLKVRMNQAKETTLVLLVHLRSDFWNVKFLQEEGFGLFSDYSVDPVVLTSGVQVIKLSFETFSE